MSDTIQVDIIDRVTDICPPCKYAAITVVPDLCVHDGYGNLKEQGFILYCKHECVCSLRSSGGGQSPSEEEIVRCKDCKYFCEDGRDGSILCARLALAHKVEPDGYCAWGECKVVEG